MNKVFLIATLPLAISAVVYVFSSIGYQLVLNRPGMAIAMFAYAVSCGGLIYDALTIGVVK